MSTCPCSCMHCVLVVSQMGMKPGILYVGVGAVLITEVQCSVEPLYLPHRMHGSGVMTMSTEHCPWPHECEWQPPNPELQRPPG
jgi:hypothetical protein